VTTTSTPALAAGRWLVDPAQATAAFRVSSFGRTVTGTVPVTHGAVEADGSGPPSAITGSLDLGLVATGNARRDTDLRKPKLLDLDRHPTMTFTADSVTAGPGGWRVTGRLTVRDTVLAVAGDAEVTVGERSATVTARAKLDRRSLGIRAPRIMIGRTVDVTVTATLRLPGPR
jgi:polyisoprenoid-binding protein YceI